jgi:hypothetical protein
MRNSKDPIVIGSKVKLDLPKIGVTKVPAKIDTGADSSSIWATNVKEKDGVLFFSLFGPKSPHYTGQILSTKNYQISSIRSSFGHIQDRYKIKLEAVITGRVINVSFTLANRSRNQFPVLIGRRTLHGKFLVDVSVKH